MTNREIISTYKMLHGLPQDTELNTYSKWKQMGYKVKHGETAQHRITIWKTVKYNKENEQGEMEQQQRMLMKDSAFFTREQVERI